MVCSRLSRRVAEPSRNGRESRGKAKLERVKTEEPGMQQNEVRSRYDIQMGYVELL